MTDIERINWLIKEINKHNYNYYTLLSPTISDKEYDKLYYELVDLETKTGVVLPDSPTLRVGGDTLDKFVKTTHKVHLYSLNKVRSFEDLESWMEDIHKVDKDTNFVLEYKFDGLQLVIEYNNGYFVSATTRGNGSVGEDVTKQVQTINSVPLSIKYKGNLIVQGEGMITKSNLKEYNKTATETLKNARNGVAGAIRNLDPKETAKRRLDFFCYSILSCDDIKFKSQAEMHEFLVDNGFKTGDYFKIVSSINEAIKEINAVDEVKEKLDVMIDGMVIKINNCEKREEIGYTIKFPKWAMAYKFEAQEVSTVLNDCIWQVGRTGRVTPIAILEPVELSGATICRATLNNFDDIQKKKVSINSRILIRRSNEVIPEVLGLLEENENSKPIIEPHNCPCCNTKLIKKGPILFCTNRDGCMAQVVDRISHFAERDALNIEGLSDKTIELLHTSLSVDEPSDLYKLTINELLSLPTFKIKKATNLINAIEKSKKVELNKFIYALGIIEVGHKLARDIANEFKTLNNCINASLNSLVNIKDIGEVIANNVYEYFKDEKNIEEINRLISQGIEIADIELIDKPETDFTNKKIVLTGGLSKFSRAEAEEIIIKLGGEPASSVSKNTDIVIAGENAGSKLVKAQELNIKIINENEFIKVIEKYN